MLHHFVQWSQLLLQWGADAKELHFKMLRLRDGIWPLLFEDFPFSIMIWIVSKCFLDRKLFFLTNIEEIWEKTSTFFQIAAAAAPENWNSAAVERAKQPDPKVNRIANVLLARFAKN